MPKERILVIEDEEDILELIGYNLGKEGYTVERASSGEKALTAVKKQLPDLVILDLMLPGIDGLEICKRLRGDSKTNHLPIIMLTAKSEDADVVAGLELGADDYITKPFSPRVLLARVRALLRRKKTGASEEGSVIRLHDFVIDSGRHELRVKGKPLQLTLTEFRILRLLARRPGWVFSRDQIVEAVHGDDYVVTDRSVDVQIVGLRKKLGNHGKYIETVRGLGYRFKE